MRTRIPTIHAEPKPRRLKPGWILLLLLLGYSIFATVLWQRTAREAQTLQTTLAEVSQSSTADPATNPSSNTPAAPLSSSTSSIATAGLWWPIPGVQVPLNPLHLPNTQRTYRQGVNQGFDFYNKSSGIPIVYGTPVIASADGVLQRVDSDYTELTQEKWDALLTAVAQSGASEEELDLLRGRELWLELADGSILRYGHLSQIRNNLEVGDRVYRGQVLGYVGNSGTDNGIAGNTSVARLHFEYWLPDGTFFGDGLTEDEIRLQAPGVFVGP